MFDESEKTSGNITQTGRHSSSCSLSPLQEGIPAAVH